jgi:hypothetical protein
MREDAAVKARRLLAEARVRVLDANEDDGVMQAEVRGDSGDVYACGWDHEGAFCDCPARSQACAHLRALWLIALEPREPRR